MRQDPVLFYDFSLSRLAVISKGIRCSPTDFLMKMLIAVDMLMPMESQNVSNSFFTSVSMRIQIVVCAIVYSYPDLHIAKSFYFFFLVKSLTQHLGESLILLRPGRLAMTALRIPPPMNIFVYLSILNSQVVLAFTLIQKCFMH